MHSPPLAAIIFLIVAACGLLTTPARSPRPNTSLQDPAPLKKGQSSCSEKPLTVDYCDLLRNADSYDRKLIRVKAIYSSHFEMSALRDTRCTRDFLWTWVDFDDKNPTCTKQEVVRSFEAAVASKSPEKIEKDLDKAEVVFVGLFEVAPHLEVRNTIPTNGYGHMGMYKFRLTVNCIEEVTALP